MFHNITGNSQGCDHIDFWLGSKLDLPQFSSSYFHLKGNNSDSTPIIFSTAFNYISEGIDEGRYTVSDIKDITTKQLYLSYIEDLPPPVIEDKFPERNWLLKWSRLKSGVLSPESRSILYLLLHERVGTRARGHRLMPGRYPSPLCPRCLTADTPETFCHRFIQCPYVTQAWEWLRSILFKLDPSYCIELDVSVLCLDFEKGMRENAALWAIGTYVDIVEQEVVIKENKLSLASITGIFKQRKQRSRYKAMPDLGLIQGIDFDQQGIG